MSDEQSTREDITLSLQAQFREIIQSHGPHTAIEIGLGMMDAIAPMLAALVGRSKTATFLNDLASDVRRLKRSAGGRVH